ncbi:MAG: TRAP transporter substrate-binding protein DctP [Pseudomonadota bacterium]
MMKKMILFFALAVFLNPSFSMADQQAAAVIKIATLDPRGSLNADLFEELKKETVAQTGNQVKLKVYYGGVHGDAKNVLNKMKVNQIHGAMLAGYGLGQIVPEVQVTGLPYIFKNYDEVQYVRDKLQDHMEQAFEKEGYIILGWYDIGFVYSFTKVPVTSLEIARQQKYWAPEGDPLAQAVYRSIGIAPISLSLTDVLTSLSTRLIDAASAPPIAAVAFRWHTKFQYMTEYPSSNVLGGLVITKPIWDTVSPENRKKVLALTRAFCRKVQEGFRKQNEQSIEIMKESGISIVRIQNAEGYQKFIDDTAQKSMAAMSGVMFSQELLDRMLGYLAEYRKANPGSRVERMD